MATSEKRDASCANCASTGQVPRTHPIFEMTGEVINAAGLAAELVAESTDYLLHFDARVLKRGIKGLEAARLLVGAGYWEYATSVARQLFELLVNMEHLGSFADRKKACGVHSAFGLLQFFLAESRRIEFEKGRGRPADSPWETSVKDSLENHFVDFRLTPRPDGSVRWRTSWSGKTTRTLAEESPDPMRVSQYELLFSTWSEQTHATPGAFATDLFVRYEDEIIDEALAKVDGVPREISREISGVGRREVQTLSMTSLLFLQLWQQLPNVGQPSPDEFSRWQETIKRHAATKGLPIF
ncbi:DUF5677 domain-containing protein [Streptomyces xinghaiensis]|uniref:DUF5677 domain-containing protein n=1 Tax=Streptomyces TaxID=1883 RepID=UPI000B0CEDE2|nr:MULTISPECIES: DUF5677 domain-containing protein [Streptomyces]